MPLYSYRKTRSRLTRDYRVLSFASATRRKAHAPDGLVYCTRTHVLSNKGVHWHLMQWLARRSDPAKAFSFARCSLNISRQVDVKTTFAIMSMAGSVSSWTNTTVFGTQRFIGNDTTGLKKLKNQGSMRHTHTRSFFPGDSYQRVLPNCVLPQKQPPLCVMHGANQESSLAIIARALCSKTSYILLK